MKHVAGSDTPANRGRPAGDAANIMVIDDSPANLKLLEGMLRARGYRVRSFPRGRLALAAAAQQPPDLVLLDVNMPELTGYEVCERLKGDPRLASIPVVFLSALSDTEDKVKAFRSGGVDYISKPFQFEEVHARVEIHLQLHDLQQALRSHNQCLEDTVSVRTRELGEANARLALLDRAKNDFLRLICHEFRTPLNGLLGVGGIILDSLSSSGEGQELRQVFERSQQRILAILDDALLLTQIDVNGGDFRFAPVSLRAALDTAIERTAEFAELRRVSLSPAIAVHHGLVLGDEDLLIRALHALLETAVKFSEGGRSVRVRRETEPGSHCVVIESEGRVIPESALPKFFDIFSIGEAITPGGDLGLGLPVAYRVLALFGASVNVANRNPAGIRLTVSFDC